MYMSAIVDEMGYFKGWCSDWTEEEINLALAQHSEWRIELINLDA